MADVQSELELDENTRRLYLSKVNEIVEEHMRSVEGNKLKPYGLKSDKGAGIRNNGIDEHGADLDEILNAVKDHVLHDGLQSNHSNNFAYLCPGGVFSSALASYLAAYTNPYVGSFETNPAGVRMEHMVIDWVAGMMGFPAGYAGNITPGGSNATLLAVTAARENINVRCGDYNRLVVYITDWTHQCFRKALFTAGLKETVIRKVPVDAEYRMDVKILKALIAQDIEEELIPFMIGSTIGTAVIGAVDAIGRIADVANEYGIWLHVDAAYGGFFVLVEELKDYFNDVCRCDSIIVDPHKSLFMPFGYGIFIVKKGKILQSCFRHDSLFVTTMQDEEESPVNISIERTKPFRALGLWLPLRLHGVAAFRRCLEEKLCLARYMYRSLKEIPGFRVGPYPQLTIVLFKYDTGNETRNNDINRELHNAILKDGHFYISSAIIDNNFFLRTCILNSRSHRNVIDEFLSTLKKLTTCLLQTLGP
ncbi:aromatic-L-amino-acid decarboxylase-like [Saccoglossus kowalevskii]